MRSNGLNQPKRMVSARGYPALKIPKPGTALQFSRLIQPGWRNWHTHADLKSAALRGDVGSNPTPGIGEPATDAAAHVMGHIVEPMDVVVVGGHGKIAMLLLELLAERGDRARGVIRKPEQAADLEAIGAEAVICDIEREELTDAVKGADAVVFAAGAGPGSGPERKRTVDHGGAVKLIEACEANGIRRYLIVSSIGAHDPSSAEGDFRAYLEAKAQADQELESSGLDFTIVRPGHLLDDPGTGLVELRTEMGGTGSVPREDVAAVLAEVLAAESTIGKTFELFSGEASIPEAVRAI